MEKYKAHILVVDDDDAIRELGQAIFKSK